MICITIDGLNFEYAQIYYKDLFPVQTMKKIKCDVRRYSDKSNPTTCGLGCLWSGERIRNFHPNMAYHVSEENRPIEWKTKDGKPLDLLWNYFKRGKFYEKIAGPNPYHNNDICNLEYENIPAKKVPSEELCIFSEVAKRDYDLFWIHTSIIKGGVFMTGCYDFERIPSLIRYDQIRKDKPFKKKVYEFALRRYKEVIRYLLEIAPDELFVITSDHGTMIDVPFRPEQIDEIPIIINQKTDLSDINFQWDVKKLLLRLKDEKT